MAKSIPSPSTLNSIGIPSMISPKEKWRILPSRTRGNMSRTRPNLTIAAKKVIPSLASGFFPNNMMAGTASSDTNHARKGMRLNSTDAI